MNTPPPPLVQIYIVDDDQGHCELISRNLKRGGILNPLRVFHDAKEALDALRHELPSRPALVLLDINMPGAFDGLELLQQVKEDEQLRRTPVVMLTTTDDPREIRRCYELGCNVYITKPIDYQQFTEVIRRVGLFLGVVQVPDHEV
jgi:CheY-like chemotaxis protein